MRPLPVREHRIVCGAGDMEIGTWAFSQIASAMLWIGCPKSTPVCVSSRRHGAMFRKFVGLSNAILVLPTATPRNAPPPSDRPREFVRAKQDVQPEREPKEIDAASLLQNVWHAQVREIDQLIDHLQGMRETLNSEASRIKRSWSRTRPSAKPLRSPRKSSVRACEAVCVRSRTSDIETSAAAGRAAKPLAGWPGR